MAWILSVAALAVAVAAVVAALLLQRRHRTQIRALIERLEAHESRLAGPSGVLTPTRPETVEGGDDGDSANPSGDVLAGHTSHVRRLVDGDGSGPVSLADQAILCVHGRLQETVSPGQMAADLYVSLRTLERGLSETLGCTPRQLILAMKMREARRLLTSGRLNVSEVAYRLGFASPSHFSRRFTGFYGRPPSAMIRTRSA